MAAPVGTKTVTLVASDQAGNTSTSTAPHAVAWVSELSAVRGDYWWTQSNAEMGGGRASKTNRAGASMTYAFTGHGVSWVASKDATSGRARVYVDGALVQTVDLQSSLAVHRQVVFAYNWTTAGAHKIAVVVEGTSGRPNVISDGFGTVN